MNTIRLPQRLAGFSLACTLLVTALPVAMAQTQYNQTTAVTQQQSYTLPAGTPLSIRETSSAGNTGDAFTGQLVNPIRANGMIIVPAGSTIQGQVSSADPVNNLRNIQLSSITTPNGNVAAFDASVAAVMPAGQAAVQEQPPLNGQVTQTSNLTTLYPRVSIGPTGITPTAKIIGGTLGGAALGAATGTLTGLTIGATSHNDIRLSNGSMAARGLGWGAAYGAGFGLLSGLIAAAVTPSPVAVTTTSNTVSYQPGQILNVALAEPATLSFGQSSTTSTQENTQPPAEMTPAQPAPSPPAAAPVRGYW